MSGHRKRAPRRYRVGRVSYYPHHGSWYLYYRENDLPVRVRVARSEEDAARLAAVRNAELTTVRTIHVTPTFEPITVRELRQRFLEPLTCPQGWYQSLC